MRRITIAICEEQTAYRERLAEYFIQKKGGKLAVATFSDRKRFKESAKEKDFDVVLLGEGFEGIGSREDEKTLQIRLSATPECAEKEPMIFKYQSADEILRTMFEYYLKLGRVESYVSRKEKEIIGVYSPTRSRLQTPFALTLARILSEDKRCLYVNLGEWAGFGEWTEEKYHRDLADLMYLLSGEGRSVQGVLESVLHSLDHMDYIPPMTDAQLLCQTGEEEYQRLLTLLVEHTDYELIFLDFGVMVPGFFSLLEQCTSLYGVLDAGIWARGQCRQFEESMLRTGRKELAERFRYVTFSGEEEQAAMQDPVLHQWLYGKLGDRARAARYLRQ